MQSRFYSSLSVGHSRHHPQADLMTATAGKAFTASNAPTTMDLLHQRFGRIGIQRQRAIATSNHLSLSRKTVVAILRHKGELLEKFKIFELPLSTKSYLGNLLLNSGKTEVFPETCMTPYVLQVKNQFSWFITFLQLKLVRVSFFFSFMFVLKKKIVSFGSSKI